MLWETFFKPFAARGRAKMDSGYLPNYVDKAKSG